MSTKVTKDASELADRAAPIVVALINSGKYELTDSRSSRQEVARVAVQIAAYLEDEAHKLISSVEGGGLL